jgi:hypothetical protein
MLTAGACASLGAEPAAARHAGGQEDTDSPYVPAQYERTFTADFLDPNEPFNRTDNPQFTTGNFRLNPDDLNTCRRLGANKERQLYVDKDFTYKGHKLGINPFSIKDGMTKDRLFYYVDGVKTLDVAHTRKVPLYVIINLGVGGSWGGDPDKSTILPASMDIDYLRIYKKQGGEW